MPGPRPESCSATHWTANSANAFLAMTPGNGATFQSRSSANGNTSWMNTSGLSAPYWVRLTRSGNNFTAYRSANGVDWTQIGSTTAITMNSTVYVGLAVTSHSSGNLCTSIFSNVSVTTPDTTSPTVTINQDDRSSRSGQRLADQLHRGL